MWRYVKFPKIVALLAFFLPWMTVSCSNQRLASGTGWQLVTGQLTIAPTLQDKAQHIDVNWLLVLAIVVILAGLAVACLSAVRARTTLATSVVALILIVGATYRYSDDAIGRAVEAKRDKDDLGLGSALAGTIHVDWHWGYWLTIVALAIAAFMSWFAWSERRANLPGNPR